MPAVAGFADLKHSLVGTALGLAFVWLSALFARERSTATARRLFLFSIIYLPLLWGALVIDQHWV
jgi:heme o synthase